MGYTHYFKGKKSNPTKFKMFSGTCRKLYYSLPEKTNTAGGYHADDNLEIAGSNGEGKPQFTDEFVVFNGKDELAHETFFIDINGTNDFCKTARKPYDLLVVACLIAAWQILDYKFSSDAFNQDGTCDDLQPAIDFYNQVIQPSKPITQEDIKKQRKFFSP